MVPEFDNPDIREFIFEGYRIIYEQRDDSVVVVSVMHSAMDSREAPAQSAWD